VARHFSSSDVQHVIEEGDPAQVIVDYANKHAIDLIMMPTHGYGPFRRFLTGSVMAKVLHDARCPLWTSTHTKRVRARAGEYRNLLCAVDCNSDAVPLIRWVGWLARHYQATVKLVYVIPALNETSRNRGEVQLRRYFFRLAHSRFAVLMDQAGFRNELLLRGGNIPATRRHSAGGTLGSLDRRPRPHTKGSGTPAHPFARHHPRISLSGYQRLSARLTNDVGPLPAPKGRRGPVHSPHRWTLRSWQGPTPAAGLANRLRFKHSDGKACNGTASAAKLAVGNGCRAREAPLMWNVSAGLAYSEKPYFS